MKKLNFIFFVLFITCNQFGWNQEFDRSKVQEGIDLYLKGAYDSAIEILTDCIELSIKSNDSVGLQMIYNNLGNAYGSKGEMELALENYQKGLDRLSYFRYTPTSKNIEQYCNYLF